MDNEYLFFKNTLFLKSTLHNLHLESAISSESFFFSWGGRHIDSDIAKRKCEINICTAEQSLIKNQKSIKITNYNIFSRLLAFFHQFELFMTNNVPFRFLKIPILFDNNLHELGYRFLSHTPNVFGCISGE